MNLFPATPELTDAHRRKLAFGNDHALRAWLREGPHPQDTLKRAIMIETERGWQRRTGIIDRLLRVLQKAERQDIEKAIMKELQKARK